jgi:hypothetical protein
MHRGKASAAMSPNGHAGRSSRVCKFLVGAHLDPIRHDRNLRTSIIWLGICPRLPDLTRYSAATMPAVFAGVGLASPRMAAAAISCPAPRSSASTGMCRGRDTSTNLSSATSGRVVSVHCVSFLPSRVESMESSSAHARKCSTVTGC